MRSRTRLTHQSGQPASFGRSARNSIPRPVGFRPAAGTGVYGPPARLAA
jgi:hypothetical protein